MSGRDVAQIVRDLEGVGLRLSVTQSFDGSVRLDRWRTMSYWSNADAAERLWSEKVSGDPSAVDDLVSFLNRPSPSIIPGVGEGSERHDRVR